MKFTRFTHRSNLYQGVMEDKQIFEIHGDMFGDWRYSGEKFLLNEVELLSPLKPAQIIGIGANYVTSLEEKPNSLPEIPVFFYKPTSSVIGPEEKIVIPHSIDQVKFESELAVVIGRDVKDVIEADVLDYVFGYTVANDVTAPQFFRDDGHWTVGKSFDTFTPLGPFIETELDPFNVNVEARLNNVEKQNGGTELMIISIEKMIAYLSTVMTLKKGDVILTGSPSGAEFSRDGDVIECKIKGIGMLRNTFVSS